MSTIHILPDTNIIFAWPHVYKRERGESDVIIYADVEVLAGAQDWQVKDGPGNLIIQAWKFEYIVVHNESVSVLVLQ